MSKEEINILQRALQREKEARRQAEDILEKKSLELFDTNESLSKVINQQEIQLKGLFLSIIDSYILMDLYGNVLKMNGEAVSFFGFDIKKEKFNVVDIIYEEDYEYAMRSFRTLIELGKFIDFKVRIYTKSKQIKWVQINSSIVYDNKGIPVFAQGIVRDITYQKLSQEKFELQKQQLDAIVDNSSLGIVLVEDHKIIKTNSAFQRMIGYSQEELSNLVLSSIKEITSRFEAHDMINEAVPLSKNNFSIKKNYKTKSGELIVARTNITMVKDEHGKVKYQVAMIEDLTEESKKGALLEALNSLMKSILGKTNMHEIAWEITKNTVSLLNFEDCVIYFLDKKKNTLKQLAAYGSLKVSNGVVIDQIEIPLGEGIVGTVAKTGISEIIDDTTKEPRYIVDDMRRYSEITVPIIAEGEIIGVIDSEHSSKRFFTSDHLKTLQTIARLAATQLKNALSLELKQKAEKEKEQLLKHLKKSNAELNDFAHVVSHDLKSPLRSMNALISWMQEDYAAFLKEAEDTHFEMLIKKVDKMDHLINGILKYAGVDKVEKQIKDINLNSILENILDTIFIPSHIEILVKKELPIVKGDKFRLQQLFQNLLSNAIKYIDKKNGCVEVDVVSDGLYWKFSIKDNGIGIDKKYFKKIFKVFQVLEEGENSTGVGLSIVKKIIDFYNGQIWVESEVDQGTTFYFKLLK